MGIKRAGWWLILFLLYAPGYAQGPAAENPQKQLTKLPRLSTLTGRIITRRDNLVLITPDAQGYILQKKEEYSEAFNKIAESADKNIEVSLSGLDAGKRKSYEFADHRTKKAWREEYRILSVTSFNSARPATTLLNASIAKPIEYKPAANAALPGLRNITGKIAKYNFRNVIPTIELAEKEGFTLIITPQTQVLKVMEGKLVNFKAEDALKEGISVQVQYEESGYKNTARVIVIADK